MSPISVETNSVVECKLGHFAQNYTQMEKLGLGCIRFTLVNHFQADCVLNMLMFGV